MLGSRCKFKPKLHTVWVFRFSVHHRERPDLGSLELHPDLKSGLCSGCWIPCFPLDLHCLILIKIPRYCLGTCQKMESPSGIVTVQWHIHTTLQLKEGQYSASLHQWEGGWHPCPSRQLPPILVLAQSKDYILHWYSCWSLFRNTWGNG